jgi:hypothetical protein
MLNKTLYISAPPGYCDRYNCMAYESALRSLVEIGCCVVIREELYKVNNWFRYMRLCMKELLKCDGLVIMPGQNVRKSTGTEVRIAASLNIPVIDLSSRFYWGDDFTTGDVKQLIHQYLIHESIHPLS